jgi:hypothetical protein
MSKPKPSVVALMLARGFIPAYEAIKLTGHCRSTVYAWIAKKRVKSERSGRCRFIEIASLQAYAPQVQITPPPPPPPPEQKRGAAE